MTTGIETSSETTFKTSKWTECKVKSDGTMYLSSFIPAGSDKKEVEVELKNLERLISKVRDDFVNV